MNDEQAAHSEPADPQPMARAVICVFVPGTRVELTPEVELKLDACRVYAHTHGFTIIEEVVESFDYLRQRVDAILRRRLANAVIVGLLSPFYDDPDYVWLILHHWLRLGAMIHSCERGPMTTEYELREWLVDFGRQERRLERRDYAPAASAPPPMSAPELDSPPTPARQELRQQRMNRPPARELLREEIRDYPPPATSAPALMPAARSWVPRAMPGVPLRTHKQPLPHDGLFIRRNNAFGTKSTLGIRELIEQGVLIEQTQIRFDDFVVTDTDQISAPVAGEAIALSHGSAAISGNYKAHEATTHFLEVALRAAPAPVSDGSRQDILPMNFVFVVDTSGSMNGEKLDTVKTAIRELYAQMRDTDIFGIVTFDTQVRTVLKATPKGQLSQDHLTSVVTDLRAEGGTDINLGVLYGIDEISRYSYQRSDLVNCLYLFSDGDPTSGETNWIKIRTNIAAKTRGDLTLSCFGFGSDARMRELDALAGLTGGHSTFVMHSEDVRLNLVEDLTRREHLAAINIQLQIEIDPDITIWHLYGHDLITDPATRAAVEEEAQAARRRARDEYGVDSLPNLITQEKGIRIFAPDLAFGETYWIVFELQVPTELERTSFGTATVQYVDTLARANRRHQLVLSETGTIPANTALVHAVGLWTSEITFYALDDLYQNDRETAKTRLSNHIQALQAAHSFVPAPQFRDDQVTFRKLISLTENLGQPVSWNEDINHGQWGYVTYTMSGFGQVRGGFVKTRSGTL